MVLKALIGSVAAVGSLVGLLSVVPADMSNLRYIDRCISQAMMPLPMGCGPYNTDLSKVSEQKSREEAILLFFLNSSSHGTQWTKLETPIDDIDRRVVSLPAADASKELAASRSDASKGNVEVAGLLTKLLAIGILI
ncbi:MULTISPECIES: hypothetical protein [unclassified Rhizobium]|uniref:hypothetical protein n=1 Tax=unclassified Rhizobium TaxID=2613769 RepID=UPI0007E9CC2E|nr:MULTISPECIES: hypothetical protein [unclassified Rhizobium]